MNQFTQIVGLAGYEAILTAEVFVVAVLCPLLDDVMVGDVANVLEHQLAHHQPDRLGRPLSGQ